MPYSVGFIMEQTLGHVTHDRNLRRWAASDRDVAPEWIEVPFSPGDRWSRLPIVRSNWSIRASLLARKRVNAAMSRTRFDALMFHTQVAALFSREVMQRVPTVVSLDATPLNLDTVGLAYNHWPSKSPLVEALKNSLNRRVFHSARHLIAWCDWAKGSLVENYGVDSDKITVIPPGIDLEKWRFDRGAASTNDRPIRLLFVGGDFQRKGGEFLLKAFREKLAERCELDIVTRDDVDTMGSERIRVHRGLQANSPELMELYARADIFVFPTLGDCLPIAVMEAMAAGLPVVSTHVGALREEVIDGVTGMLIPPGDSGPVGDSVKALVDDASMRYEMGRAGRERALQKFDGSVNYREVLRVVKRCADGIK
jgi:glycosyltransferase involved in cell wall biosynthesis